MCGVGALLRAGHTADDLSLLVGPFMDRVRHRGPDGEGFLLLDPTEGFRSYRGHDTPSALRAVLPALPAAAAVVTAALGHRRLAIVDVTANGHQPMVSANGRFAVTYNGEIYNHEEIRRELAERGYSFVSTSDTEVLLHAYAEWGKDALSRFNGMFAFVLLDRVRGVALAVRDRFAVKPLYVWQSSTGLVAFASEIKQFLGLPGFRPKMNRERALDFLGWGLTDHTEETLFDGVRQVPGGHWLEVQLDRPRAQPLPTPTPWYTLRPGAPPRSYEEARLHVRQLVIESVGLRLRADVPVGVALSGGVDSSSIACTAYQVLGGEKASHRLQTFSACSHIERFDERQHIEPVVAAINAVPHYVTPDVRELFQSLDRLAWHHDEPFGGTSIFAEWEVFRLVGGTPVRVTLDGHGADELFAGYPAFVGSLLTELLIDRRLGEVRRQLAGLRGRPGQSARALAGLLFHTLLPDGALQRLRRLSGRVPTTPGWFRPIDAERRRPPQAEYRRASWTVAGASRAQLLTTSLPMQLKWADRDSMAHSIESRTPSLDYRLVEYVLGCPPEYKIRGGVQKALLRDAMAGIVPARTLARRDKMGFVTAEEYWVRNEANAEFRAELDAAYEATSAVLSRDGYELASRVVTGEDPFNLLLWRMISFGRWARRFEVDLS